MNFVIPMAGRGKRFVDEGYSLPKMLIKAHGKTLLEWSVDSLPLELCSRLIFVGLATHNKNRQLENYIIETYAERVGSVRFVWLDHVTRGQAETVLKGLAEADHAKPLVAFNIDTFFKADSLAADLVRNDVDAVIGAFRSREPKFSYAKLNSTGFVEATREKVVISDFALTGLYHFRETSDFIRIAESNISSNIRAENEFYIAPLYNALIQEGKKVIVNMSDEVWILGTPDELIHFQNHYNPESFS